MVLQFGKYRSTATEGLNWRVPYPFQSHELVNISQVRNVEVGFQESASVKRRNPKESLVLTDDENIIDIQFVVQYEIRDPLEFLFNNKNAEDAVKQVAETAIRGQQVSEYVLNQRRVHLVNLAMIR